MSTVGIDAAERLLALAAQRDVAFVDAPVLGTRKPAEQGELMVLAAGPEAVRERCAPCSMRWVVRCAEVGVQAGAASRFKLVLNAWLLSLTETLSETIAFAGELDVDPAEFLDAIDGGPLGFGYAQLKGRPMIALAFDEVAFSLSLAAKDARLVHDAIEAIENAESRLPFFAALDAQYARGAELGHGGEDMAAVHHAARFAGS